MEVQQQNLFSVLEKGDRKIKKAHQKAIILVGLTRAGKSTAFNWILHKPMVGKGKVNTCYVNVVNQDQSAAIIGDSYASVTLAPNIHIDFQKDVSLIDMAGYEDTRDFIGVIGVSYFLKALFEQVRQAKFIIVFDQLRLREQGGPGIIKTFNGFINMFHYRQLSPSLQQKLKQSISVVITRSEKPQAHFDHFDDIVEKLQDVKFQTQNKDLVIQLMKDVRNRSRIEAFKIARNNVNPQQCSFIQRFTTGMKWQYFNLDEAEAEHGKSVISLPFDRDFKNLSKIQQDKFTSSIQHRVASYVDFSKILTVFIENFVSNWNLFLDEWKESGNINNKHFQMKQLFDQVRKFVQANDVYNSKDIIQLKFKVSYDPLTLIQSIKQILNVYKRVDDIGANDGSSETFSQAMNLFTTKFADLVQCIKKFASNNEEQELLLRLDYILVRGFREFSKLYQLKEDCIHDSKQKLRDNCGGVFQEDKKVFIQRFVKELSSDLLIQLFKTIELLEQYQKFFKQYQDDYKELQDPIFFSEQRCNIQMAKAGLLLAAGKKYQALECFIRALRNMGQISVHVSKSVTKSEPQRIEELNKLSMKKLKLIRRISNILKMIPNGIDFNPKMFALNLCLHHKMTEDVCQIYQLIINSSSGRQKLQMLQNYATYCSKWGRVEQAIIQLQIKLSFQEDNFDDYTNTQELIKNHLVQREANLKQYNTTLAAATAQKSRLPESDTTLDRMLEELQMHLRNIPTEV